MTTINNIEYEIIHSVEGSLELIKLRESEPIQDGSIILSVAEFVHIFKQLKLNNI